MSAMQRLPVVLALAAAMAALAVSASPVSTPDRSLVPGQYRAGVVRARCSTTPPGIPRAPNSAGAGGAEGAPSCARIADNLKMCPVLGEMERKRAKNEQHQASNLMFEPG